jgi:sortase A
VERKQVMLWTGMGLCALGVIIGAKVPYFYLYSKIEGAQLVRQAETVVKGTTDLNLVQNNATAMTEFPLLPVLDGETKTLPDLPADSVIGLVHVPALQLTAPLLEGTAGNVLNAGVGHFQGSASPGMPGTCVIAAHNATWFRHLDNLHVGDHIVLQTSHAQYEYQVTGALVVSAGDKVQNTAKPTVVLEACYPLDALYLTSKRYLVTGVLVSTRTSGMQSQFTLSSSPNYIAHIPKDILQQGVTLSENQLPMGSLHFDGSPDPIYTESNAPLSAVYTILQLYLSYVHASFDRNIPDLNQILESMAGADGTASWLDAQMIQNPFFGLLSGDISYDSKFDISLQVTGNTLTGANAVTVIKTPAGQYQVKMMFSVHENILSIYSIDIHKVNM